MTLEVATHRSVLIRILKDIYNDMELAPFLGFKGGTATYLFYGLNRFSVDLDFDLLEGVNEDLIFKKIENILVEYGSLLDVRKKRFSFFYLLSYDNKIQNAYNIKVEVNRRNFGSKYEIKSYLGIAMKVMVLEDIVANKIVATFEREGKANRDIFDVYFFLKNNCPINEKIIQVRTNMRIQEFWKKFINLLEGVNSRTILSGLGELIDAKQKIWVKEKLISEVIFLLKLKLNGT